MSCCGKKIDINNSNAFSVMGRYKYLTQRQINARLEVFKKINCKSCSKRYDCNFDMYNKCTIRPQIK